ncbi:MAG: hypothetical protein H0V62_15495 [Gammaproteobacteria bacterium]|nr:hypothetical protein [Gammaproteobacteria bacterium]
MRHRQFQVCDAGFEIVIEALDGTSQFSGPVLQNASAQSFASLGLAA